jgi:hypothetical protein
VGQGNGPTASATAAGEHEPEAAVDGVVAVRVRFTRSGYTGAMTDHGGELPLEQLTGEALPPEEPFDGEDVPDEQLEVDHEGLLDRVRDTGVGVEDPNIVGDVGPTDVPPGADPEPVS